MIIEPIDDNNSNFELVYLNPKPHCKDHGAMLKVSEAGLWRCIRTKGAKDCRAGCIEIDGWCPICQARVTKRLILGKDLVYDCQGCGDQIAEPITDKPKSSEEGK